MIKQFTRGVITGIIIYAIGSLVTFAFYRIYGWDNARGLPTPAIPILFTLAIGFGRFFIAVNGVKRGSTRSKGELLVHMLVATAIVAWIVVKSSKAT